MKKILILPECQILAHSTRPFEIAVALRDSGFNIRVASSGRYLSLFKNAGFECVETPSLDEKHALKVLRSGRLHVWQKAVYKRALARDLEIVKEFAPDAILADFRLTAKTVCEITKTPYISIVNGSWTKNFTIPFRAPENFILSKLLGRALVTFLMPILKKTLINLDVVMINRVRRQFGCSKKLNFLELLEGDLNLIVDVPSYGPVNLTPQKDNYVGSLTWSPKIPAPSWFVQLKPNKTTLYFTVGSTGDLEHVRHLLAEFSDDKYQCLVTTGGIGELNTTQKNVFVAPMAPGELLLQKSNIIVCHGGNGTIYQALTQGIPIVGIPTMHDQEFNMQRVEDLGAGRAISHLKFTVKRAKETILEVLQNEAYRINAMKLQKEILCYDAKKRSVELIGEFLRV